MMRMIETCGMKALVGLYALAVCALADQDVAVTRALVADRDPIHTGPWHDIHRMQFGGDGSIPCALPIGLGGATGQKDKHGKHPFHAYIITSFLLFPAISHANDPWNTTDKALGAGLLAARIVDWGQTLYVAKHPGLFVEKNAFLGDPPSVGKVNIFFLGTTIGGFVLLDAVPSDYRRWGLVGALMVQAGIIAHNRSIGVKVEF